MVSLHTYEYECPKCYNKIKMEIHRKLDRHIMCPCGQDMDMVFYLRSPDTRAE